MPAAPVEDAEYDEDAPWSRDWQPDPHLIPAVLAAGNRAIASIKSKQDRCWLVAGLKVEGLTAEDMRDRLKCSLRLIRSLLAEDMTTVCLLYHAESMAFREELRLSRHELTVRTRELSDTVAEAIRVREQRDRMIDMAMTGDPIRVCRRAGHVMDKYNTYTDPGTGKTSCRQCRHDAVKRSRDRNNSGITADAQRHESG